MQILVLEIALTLFVQKGDLGLERDSERVASPAGPPVFGVDAESGFVLRQGAEQIARCLGLLRTSQMSFGDRLFLGDGGRKRRAGLVLSRDVGQLPEAFGVDVLELAMGGVPGGELEAS